MELPNFLRTAPGTKSCSRKSFVLYILSSIVKIYIFSKYVFEKSLYQTDTNADFEYQEKETLLVWGDNGS